MTFTRTLLAVALAGAFTAQAQEAEMLANGHNLEVVSDALFVADNHTIRLVAPDGRIWEETVHDQAVANVDLSRAFQGQLPDGQYRFEVRPGLAAEKSLVPDNLRGLEVEAHRSAAGDPVFGTITVKNGVILDPNAVEPTSGPLRNEYIKADGPSTQAGEPSLMAQVFATDLIVQGSQCLGIDCTSSESFGFDTLRLKENNLRIHFNDTSSSSSFPSTDWEIIANDSANGGASYLGVIDRDSGRRIVTFSAGAPSNALFLHSTGRIGLGTTTPTVKLHLVDGNTPTTRLEQNNSAGFAAQTWDLAGNESNFFIRDITNGSKLPFRIRPGAPTSSIDIAANGNVGVGTQSPSAKLHVTGSSGETNLTVEETAASTTDRTMLNLRNNGGARIIFDDTSASNNDWVFASTGNSLFRITKVASGSTEFEVDGSGNLTISGSLTTAANTYPDYVFEEGYELMPITEVESFIKANGHLPNVKPAEAIIRDGLDLTEGHIKLMEKVEELTLYTIEQQKMIDELRTRLASLNQSE